jgi:glycosyltransferase involved in cell wall biosynthesis
MRIINIHATNIRGHGAVNLCLAVLEELDKRSDIVLEKVLLPYSGPLSEFRFKQQNPEIVRRKRRLPNVVSRLFECLFLYMAEPIAGELLVLGDLPLRGYKNQRLLFHQANILIDHRNIYARVKYVTGRYLLNFFGVNLRKIILQSAAIKNDFDAVFPALKCKTQTLPLPLPDWAQRYKRTTNSVSYKDGNSGLILLYPAEYYPYKNHKLLEKLAVTRDVDSCIRQIRVTIKRRSQLEPENSIVKYLGYCTKEQLVKEYTNCHAIVFPSTCESSPLTLLEAMAFGLPIIISNLPFAQEMCGDQAFYFDPTCPRSLLAGCQLAESRLASGWQPDYQNLTKTRPHNWREYTASLIGVQ